MFSKNIKFLWGIFRPYQYWLLLMIQAPMLSAVYIFANNYSLKLLINTFADNNCTEINDALWPISVFVLAQVGQGASWRISNIAEWNSEPLMRKDLLIKVYDYVQHHSIDFFQETPAGNITSKIKGIMDGYDYIMNLHHTLIRSFCIVLLSLIVLMFSNIYIFVFILLWYTILIYIMFPMCIKLNDISSHYANSKHSILGIISDNITNILSLCYFAKRNKERDNIELLIANNSVPKHLLLEKYNCQFALVFNILYWIMLFTVLVSVIKLKLINSIDIGEVIFILLTCITISLHLWDFISGLGEFLKHIGDFNTSCSLLEIPHQLVDVDAAQETNLLNGSIEIENLTFTYTSDVILLNNLHLSISNGEKIGIVGPSGAGKSTLIHLLLKNHLAQSGDIIIGDINIHNITSDSLRSQISFIPQDIILFNKSIAENIGYGMDSASIAEIREAAKLANISDFIESLPDQYNTIVGERGIKMSGGQRQMIAIARAFIKKSPILILDEATSNLDTITELQIQNSISTLLDRRKLTVIAIAHRLSTIRYMDRIIVMDHGVIVEDGSFKELSVKKNSYFMQLWNNQINNKII